MGPKLSRPLVLLCLLASLLAATALAACGEEENPTEVEEGEPIDIGPLSYNVLFTRFLNKNDVEDVDYLTGQPPLEPGKLYLGVFVEIENEGEDDFPSYPAGQFRVTDTEGAEYEPIESESDFALDFGAEVPAEGQLPLSDSTADSGPIEGALMLFEVDDNVTENRPLKLDIASVSDEGEVILDI